MTADEQRDLHNAVVTALFRTHGIECPPELGGLAFARIRQRLKSERLCETLADDIFQDLLIAAHRGLGKMPPRNPQGWFLVIGRNVTINFLVKHAKHEHLEMDEALNGQGLTTGIEFSDERPHELLEEALQTLPPRYAQLIKLDMKELLSAKETQSRMQISYGYYRKLKSQAFKALREALKDAIAAHS